VTPSSDLFAPGPSDRPELNPEQSEAAEHVEGPILVLAGAGSGKTRVLTARIARLIDEHGVPPHSILSVTFTNKAAGEMRQRIRSVLGRDPVGAWIGTFHSIGARLLRRHAESVGWDPAFTIFDAEESLREIKRVMTSLDLDPKRWKPKAVRSAISDAKNQLVPPSEFLEQHGEGFDFFLRTVARVYGPYQNSLREQNAFDFDDLLVKPVEVFRAQPDLLRKYQERFSFILVDEYQDTNRAQFHFLELLARGHGNLMVVGDDDQCVVAGTPIAGPDGATAVEDIRDGDPVLAAAGQGRTATATALPHPARRLRGPVIRVTTEGGRELAATPNHMLFGRWRATPGWCLVLHEEAAGVERGFLRYWLEVRRGGPDGQRMGVSSEGECRMPRAGRRWVLHTASSRDAAFGESRLLAGRLGGGLLPDGGPSPVPMAVDQVEDFLVELMLFPEHPHSELGASGSPEVIYTLFGGEQAGSDPRPDVPPPSRRNPLAQGTASAAHLLQLGAPANAAVGAQPGHPSGWSDEWLSSPSDHDHGWRQARALAAREDGPLRLEADLTAETGSEPRGSDTFMLLPISHLFPGMEVAALGPDGTLRPDRIVSRVVEWFEGTVHDLSVTPLRNYLAGGICVHNSIYGWRGADISNILDFERTFPGAKVVRLERNYRSTSTILQAANEVIRRNIHRKDKTLRTEAAAGERISLVETADERDEAGWIAEEIEARLSAGEAGRYRDFAVLYRTNAQSRALEDAFRRKGLPYQIVGGVRFYERREIQDVLAYLRLVSNPRDSAAFERVVNVPKRGVGATSRKRLVEWAAAEGVSLLEAGIVADRVPALHSGGARGILRFSELIQRFSARAATLSVGPLLEELLEELDFLAHLRDEGPDGEDRAENVKELVAGAMDFDSTRVEQAEEEGALDHFSELDLFLQHVALVTDIDRHDPDSDAVTLMTLHNAKGLEFPSVFIAGLEEGLFPLGRAYDEPIQLEEERRLFYVGITRAEGKLYLSWARERRRAGDFMFGRLSSFVEDVPESLLESRRSPRLERERQALTRQGRAGGSDRTFGTAGMAGARRAEEEREFEEGLNQDLPHLVKGERVEHETFGSGTVADVSGFGRDLRVTVDFDGAGRKKLLARYARLRKEF
jgi:DNA helicase II / ATP-dependent DNA helicase PcrA